MSDTQLATVDAETDRVAKSLGRLRSVGELMDDAFEIPIVKVKVGLDPLIGLIPGGGDWVSWIVSVYIVLEAARLGIPARKLARMGWNITVDLIVGYVPGVGDFFDVLYKANRRNVQIALDHFDAKIDASAPGVVVVPDGALEARDSNALTRWAVALGLVLLSFGLAAVPFIVLYYIFAGG